MRGGRYNPLAPPAVACAFPYGACLSAQEIGYITDCNDPNATRVNGTAPAPPSDAFEVALADDGGPLLEAKVPSGAAVAPTVGRASGVPGAHDACVALTRAEPTLLEVGALREVEARLFGRAVRTPAFVAERVTLNLETLGSDRLYWLLRAAVATDHLHLQNCSCTLNASTFPAHADNNATVTRALGCVCRATGAAPLWALHSSLAVWLFETSERFPGAAGPVTQVHMALSKRAENYSAPWLPQRPGGVPWLQDAPADSWMESVHFGGDPEAGLSVDVTVAVSSLAVNVPWCRACPPAGGYARGVTLEVARARQRPLPDGSFALQGAERFVPLIRAGGAVFLPLRSHVDLSGCVFPATLFHEFNLTFSQGAGAPAEFLPAGTVRLVGPATASFRGVRAAEDTTFHLPVDVSLRDNEPFLLHARLRSLRGDRYNASSGMHGRGNTSGAHWPRPFGARWLELGETDVDVTARTRAAERGILFEHIGAVSAPPPCYEQHPRLVL